MNSVAKRAIAALLATTVLTSAHFALTAPPAAPAFQSVKSLYASKCAVCHGNDGSANTAKGKELKVRNLRSEEFKKMPDDNRPASLIIRMQPKTGYNDA